jgi:hypothetical protein
MAVDWNKHGLSHEEQKKKITNEPNISYDLQHEKYR